MSSIDWLGIKKGKMLPPDEILENLDYVDENIKNLVVYLNKSGAKTTNSCGHDGVIDVNDPEATRLAMVKLGIPKNMWRIVDNRKLLIFEQPRMSVHTLQILGAKQGSQKMQDIVSSIDGLAKSRIRRPNPQGGETCEELGDIHASEGYTKTDWQPIEPKGRPEGDNYYGYPNKKELEETLAEVKTHVGERVLLSGGGGPGSQLGILKGAHIEPFNLIIDGVQRDRWGLKVDIKLDHEFAGSKDFDPWLDNWQIAVKDKHRCSLPTVELDLPDETSGSHENGFIDHKGYSYTTKTGKTIHVKPHKEKRPLPSLGRMK